MDWESLEQACNACTKCQLCQGRTNVVFGVGNETAEILLIGEGPGQSEDEQGIPFVGKAGMLLDDMLSIIDLDRQTNCYIANIVKCRPPRNRDPLETEQDACIGYLRNQVALIQPKIIVCLGRIAAQRIIDPKNLGFASKKDEAADYSKMKSNVMEEVKRLFKPEFINRIDEIMVFHPLTEKDMKQIITLLSKNLCDRCRTQMEIELTFTNSLKEYLVNLILFLSIVGVKIII